MKYLILIMASLVYFGLPVSAQTESLDITSDVRCVIVGARLAASTDANKKATATLLMIYYIGKLNGRAPGVDLEKLIIDQATRMTSAEYDAELRGCSKALVLKGQEITRIGNDLTRMGK